MLYEYGTTGSYILFKNIYLFGLVGSLLGLSYVMWGSCCRLLWHEALVALSMWDLRFPAQN